jgi:hypothetical protein
LVIPALKIGIEDEKKRCTEDGIKYICERHHSDRKKHKQEGRGIQELHYGAVILVCLFPEGGKSVYLMFDMIFARII